MDMQVRQVQQNEAPQRGNYGDFRASDCPEWVRTLKADAERAGCWSSGIDGDGDVYEAINADIYGWAEINGDRLALVQVRRASKRRRRYLVIQKNYLIIGRNENGEIFGHGVPSPRRSSTAMSSPEAAVRWILANHVWHCEIDALDHIVRQGDIALIPILRMPTDAQQVEGSITSLRGSHILRGDLYRTPDGALFARGVVVIDHAPGEHRHVRSKKGVWRVQEGQRADLWGFLGRAPNAD